MHDPVQRTSSWQSSASGASSRSGGGSSKAAPVPKPRFTVGGQAAGDEVDAAASRRPGREARRRAVPETQARKPGVRSQSSPADRAKLQQAAPAHHAKAATPSRNGVVAGRSGTPRSHQPVVDRSLGSVDSPLSAFVDRTGLVFDVRSKAAYRRGRLLGKVRLNYTPFSFLRFLWISFFSHSALTLLVGCQEGHSACKKLSGGGAGVVIRLERGADLHMAQLMPLPLAVTCFSIIQIGFTFLVPAHPGSPEKGPLNVCVCVCGV